ncbi:RDD family protein [Actinomycetospora rhizophila]|uniref:RDD family protein n=1 Tax=Actinomycetospora rhizophila TaxID=1416876 RepID=A0ABV9ZIS5_9PSEU
MAWFREWLEGSGGDGRTAAPPSAPRETPRTPAPGATEEGYPGERFGLPERGPGSVATLGRRGAQFLLDAVLAGVLAALFTYPALPQNWSLLTWAIIMVVPVAVVGATPAMVLLGMRVVRLDRPERPGVGLLWTLVRTASLFFVIPALIVDRDSRGIQDRASRTVVVKSR